MKSIPTTTNVDGCFPDQKKEQPIGKGRVPRRGREGVRADFMSKNSHFMEHGQPHA